ncbi:MAG: hypothetical protein M0C28_15395 [Candidatus Moduliflexus flocculans]|nr:hypothetical protein [Candidatus Moduliflexus flocculans]
MRKAFSSSAWPGRSSSSSSASLAAGPGPQTSGPGGPAPGSPEAQLSTTWTTSSPEAPIRWASKRIRPRGGCSARAPVPWAIRAGSRHILD